MNQSIFKTIVSFLPRVDCDDTDIEERTLGGILVSGKWRKQVQALREETSPERREELKAALPCFTPSGTFTSVCRAGLAAHSGFISVDIDYKPEKGINTALAGFDLKAAIAAVPQVAYCGHSCGGTGYVLIIPIADPEKHLEYFRALQYHFDRAGLEIDRACKDITRKRFVSWDADPYINTAARPWGLVLPESKITTRAVFGRDLNAEETAARVEAVIRTCENNKWDITENYEDWIKILAAFAHTFGENGREYAHRISALYSGYNATQTEAKYNSLLRNPLKEGNANIGTFFYIARAEMGKRDFDNIPL